MKSPRINIIPALKAIEDDGVPLENCPYGAIIQHANMLCLKTIRRSENTRYIYVVSLDTGTMFLMDPKRRFKVVRGLELSFSKSVAKSVPVDSICHAPAPDTKACCQG